MPQSITELLEERGSVEAKINALIDSAEDAGDLGAEKEAEYEALLAESSRLKMTADRIQRQADVKSELSQIRDDAKDHGIPIPGEDVVNTAFRGWLKTQCSGSRRPKPTDEELQAAEKCGFNVQAGGEIEFPLMSVMGMRDAYNQHRAGVLGLNRSIGEQGGFFVAETFVGAFEVAQLAYGGVLQVADIIRTAKGGDLVWPTFDDEGELATRTTEGKTTGNAKTLKFNKTKWGAHKYETGILKVHYETLRDVDLDLPRLIGEAFGERMGRRQSADFTNGTGGADQAQGIVTGSVLGKTAASATAITFDEMMDLEYSIDPVMRKQGAGFMFNDATAKLLRKIKDGDGHYIWERAVTAGQPDRIFGYEATPNYDMDGPTASKKSVLFGLLSKYKVRQVGQLRSYRATELFIKEEADGFLGFLEADGGILNPSKSAAGAPIKHLIQAA